MGIMVPILVFDPAPDMFTITMDWATLIFWTFDMVASCCTGYIFKGHTVMDPVKIFKYYARTWLVLDVLIIVPDWIFTILDLISAGASSSAKATNLLRSLRMVRVLRLLRL